MICDGCNREVYRAKFIDPKWFCKECAPSAGYVNVPGAMFPFTTSNLSKDPTRPITVNSLRHLRKLEAKYGVQSVGFNMNSNHFEIPLREKR
jgi:hypothetical protein